MFCLSSLVLVTSSTLFTHVQSVTRELVNDSVLEFTRWDPPLKEHIHFTVGTTLRLRKTEIGPSEAEEADASPELSNMSAFDPSGLCKGTYQSSLCTPVPCCRIDHSWDDDVIDDTPDVVEVTCQNDRLGLESSGRDFGDE